MMLRAQVYATSPRICSPRRAAEALQESVNFTWLSGNIRSDSRTVNRSRGTAIEETVQGDFGGVLQRLVEDGHVRFERYIPNGPKVVVHPKRHQWIWAKRTKKHREELHEDVNTPVREIGRVNKAEEEKHGRCGSGRVGLRHWGRRRETGQGDRRAERMVATGD